MDTEVPDRPGSHRFKYQDFPERSVEFLEFLQASTVSQRPSPRRQHSIHTNQRVPTRTVPAATCNQHGAETDRPGPKWQRYGKPLINTDQHVNYTDYPGTIHDNDADKHDSDTNQKSSPRTKNTYI
ncbi:hypothetical protein DPMN_116357 [Dreissena polymorpha]|uniref:Uncharacterized protein n=1 Tax=Dreissena polymorpha TaxID=45954 RepID=A0A9D4KNN9_DREPO|nr:hypothetical protein DPMN_116357 [Dreissena polymorpha]